MEKDFFESLIPSRGEFLDNLREKCAKEESYAPIIRKDTEQFLIAMLKLIKPERVLEIGTAVGYSAILMAENLPPESTILTVERYEKHADLAIDNIFKVGLENKIRVIKGEAIDVLSWLDGTFDFIFLDAAKGQYIEFLPYITKLLKSGGVLISDNVLYHGMIEDDDKVIRRKITIVKRLRMYLEEIMNSSSYTSSLLSVGDGIAISVKK